MSEWTQYRLKDLLADRGYIRGPFGSSLKREEMQNEGVPVYEQVHAIYNTREFRFFVDNEKFNELKRFRVKENDLIISCSGTVGKISIIKANDPKGIISQALLLLRPDTTKVFAEYLLYFFRTREGFHQLLNASHGSVQPNIASRDVVESIPIRIPDKALQEEILLILRSLDAKIDLLHRQNTTLEALAETLFRQWFVEGPGNETRIELGKIAEVGTGKGLKREKFDECGRFPVLGANGEIGKTNDFLADERLILTGRVGTLGKVYINEGKAWISDNVLIIRPRDIRFFYPIYFTLKRIDFENLNVGSTQPLVTQTDLKKVDLALLDDELINEFSVQCLVYFEKQSKNKQQIRALTLLRDTLLQKLMSGAIRVSS